MYQFKKTENTPQSQMQRNTTQGAYLQTIIIDNSRLPNPHHLKFVISYRLSLLNHIEKPHK